MKTRTFIIILVSVYIYGALSLIALTSDIKSEDLLILRNLQYEQAKRIVKMQELRNEFDKLNSEQQSIGVEIDNWIRIQAKNQNVDLATHTFDLDKMKFVEIPKAGKPND